MVRDLEKESNKIRNGTRYVVDDTEGAKGVFSRDMDRLFREYRNLRLKTYNTFKGRFNDETSRTELQSYIDEQFVKLVKEYEINSPVDFPGYIKKKLTLRVEKSYVEGKIKEKYREALPNESEDIERMIEDDSQEDSTSIEDDDLRQYVFGATNFNELEHDIVNMWLAEKWTEREIVQHLMKKHKKKRREIELTMQELREFVVNRISTYNK